MNKGLLLILLLILTLPSTVQARPNPEPAATALKLMKDPSSKLFVAIKAFQDLKKADAKRLTPLLLADGLKSSDPRVFRTAFCMLIAGKHQEPLNFLATKGLKMVKNDVDTTTSILVILSHSDDPAHWAVGSKYVNAKSRSVRTAAAELVGQGWVPAAAKLANSLENRRGRDLSIACKALDRLTGNKVGRHPQAHQRFIKENAKTIRDSEALARPTGRINFFANPVLTRSSYIGQKLELADTMFCMDTSMSMQPDEPVILKKYTVGDSIFPEIPKGNNSKIWGARIALCETLKKLDERMKFGVVTFGGRVDAWEKSDLKMATLGNRAKAARWVISETPLTIGTMLGQSLVTAMRNDGTENIMLLTDGAPFPSMPPRLAQEGNIPFARGCTELSKPYFDTDFLSAFAFKARMCRRQTLSAYGVGAFGPLRQFLAKLAKQGHGTYKDVKFRKFSF